MCRYRSTCRATALSAPRRSASTGALPTRCLPAPWNILIRYVIRQAVDGEGTGVPPLLLRLSPHPPFHVSLTFLVPLLAAARRGTRCASVRHRRGLAAFASPSRRGRATGRSATSRTRSKSGARPAYVPQQRQFRAHIERVSQNSSVSRIEPSEMPRRWRPIARGADAQPHSTLELRMRILYEFTYRAVQ